MWGSHHVKFFDMSVQLRVQIDPKEQGGQPRMLWGVWMGEIFQRIFSLNFQVKNAGFYAFVLLKTTCGQKPEGV